MQILFTFQNEAGLIDQYIFEYQNRDFLKIALFYNSKQIWRLR